MKNAMIVGGNGSYRRLFQDMGFALVAEMSEASLVVFTGGEDVTPALYGDKAHGSTFNNSLRDEHERALFNACVIEGVPMAGICRGGQFLNVMNGGRMYQHVTKHAVRGTHPIVIMETGETIEVSSTHHQMFMPAEDAEVLAVANLHGEREWYDGQVFCRDKSNTDYEVLFYDKTNSLCFQPHPEFVGEEFEPMKKYFAYLLKSKLGV